MNSSLRAKTGPALILALLPLALGACAPAVQRFGSVAETVSAQPDRGFVMAQESSAASAVRAALVQAGMRPDENGKLRIEVGFAVRPRKLAVHALDDAKADVTVSPTGASAGLFCSREAYVLTIALVDRASGKVLRRSGASLSRCRGGPEAVLPVLARAALPVSS